MLHATEFTDGAAQAQLLAAVSGFCSRQYTVSTPVSASLWLAGRQL